jgi:hypothetical protein
MEEAQGSMRKITCRVLTLRKLSVKLAMSPFLLYRKATVPYLCVNQLRLSAWPWP